MRKELPLFVAGIIFSLVAIIHLLRLFYHWEITISGHLIPMSVSIYGLIITGILAIWMFSAARHKN